jgi:hypothetical protein
LVAIGEFQDQFQVPGRVGRKRRVGSTYLGGAGNDEIDALFPLDDGSIVVIGRTDSADFPDFGHPCSAGAVHLLEG